LILYCINLAKYIDYINNHIQLFYFYKVLKRDIILIDAT